MPEPALDTRIDLDVGCAVRRMLHAEQVGSRAAGDHGATRQHGGGSAAGQRVVVFESSVGVDVVPLAKPGRAAELLRCDCAGPYGVVPAKHAKGERLGATWHAGHAEQRATAG